MRKSTRSILQELSDLGLSRNTDMIVESRASNITKFKRGIKKIQESKNNG